MISTEPRIPVKDRDFLGEGKKRRCYLHPNDNNLVVKEALHYKAWELNSREYHTWRLYRKTQFGQWLNPTLTLIQKGIQITQPRVTPYNDLDPELQLTVEQVQQQLLADKPAWVQRYFSSLHIWSIDQDQRIRVYDYEHLKTPDVIEMSKMTWLSWDQLQPK